MLGGTTWAALLYSPHGRFGAILGTDGTGHSAGSCVRNSLLNERLAGLDSRLLGGPTSDCNLCEQASRMHKSGNHIARRYKRSREAYLRSHGESTSSAQSHPRFQPQFLVRQHGDHAADLNVGRIHAPGVALRSAVPCPSKAGGRSAGLGLPSKERAKPDLPN